MRDTFNRPLLAGIGSIICCSALSLGARPPPTGRPQGVERALPEADYVICMTFTSPRVKCCRNCGIHYVDFRQAASTGAASAGSTTRCCMHARHRRVGTQPHQRSHLLGRAVSARGSCWMQTSSSLYCPTASATADPASQVTRLHARFPQYTGMPTWWPPSTQLITSRLADRSSAPGDGNLHGLHAHFHVGRSVPGLHPTHLMPLACLPVQIAGRNRLDAQ